MAKVNNKRRDKNGRFVSKTQTCDINNNNTEDSSEVRALHDHTYSSTKKPHIKWASLSAAPVLEIPPNDCNHSVISSSEKDTTHPKCHGRITTKSDIDTEDEHYLHENPRKINWKEGRRVVEIAFMAEQLYRGCITCHQPLHLINCVDEQHFGLGSIYSIVCSSCQNVTLIYSGKRHISTYGVEDKFTRKSSYTWDVNTKLASGMLHTGLGTTSVNALLACLNIPDISPKSLKAREREVGRKIEDIAKKSCEEYAAKEIEFCNDEGLEVSFDAGWQKRGSGRSYNSLSGHACMIGSKTGKIISYAVRNKSCRFCENAALSKEPPKQHDCRKNWDGSAKGMECDMAVSMLKDLEDKNISVETIVMDDDTTTIARARKEVKASLKKKSDANHAKKHFTNKLYGLQIAKKYRQLGTKTISHLKKCFNNIIAMNKKNPGNLKSNLKALTPHLFGDHSNCSQNCGYVRNPGSYIPKNLPYRRYLSDTELKDDLQETISTYADQAEKLANLGSSQSNESFNNTVASKAPKRMHFSGSESTSFRVAAAAVQKNLGSNYVLKVNEELLLSPGEHTKKVLVQHDLKRTRDCERKSSTPFKKRRSSLKSKKQSALECNEMREGTTYASGVNLGDSSMADDIHEIPPPSSSPTISTLADGNYTFICFDLETTGLGLSSITQIAASLGERQFNQYVLPDEEISHSASATTGISFDGIALYKEGEKLDAVPLPEALARFSTWIKEFNSPVLVSHNAKSFDSVVFMNSVSKTSFNFDHIIGFVDSLPLFKDLLPGKKSYSQSSLVHDAGLSYNAHNALDDAVALESLVKFHSVSESTMLKYSFPLSYVYNALQYRKSKIVNLNSLSHLVSSKILSKFMAEKIAASGLCYQHLKLSFERNGYDGIEALFKESVDGKPRVTRCKKIISAVFQHFSKFSKGGNL